MKLLLPFLLPFVLLAPGPTPYTEPPYLLLIGDQILLSDANGIFKVTEMPELFTVINNDESLRYQLGLALGRHYEAMK